MALLDSDRTTGRPAEDVRLPILPAQRSGDAPLAGDAVPHPDDPTPADPARPAGAADPAPAAGAADPGPAPRVRLHRRPVVLGVAVATLLTLGVGATSVAMTVQQNAREAESVRETSRVEAVAEASDSAFAHRLGVARTQQARADHARDLADRTAAVTAAAPQVDAARGVLAAAPQASPETRAALGFAVDGAAALLAHDPPPQIADVAAALQALTALQTAVVDSQAAWQTAEDTRVAAEAAAAQAAAHAAAQAAQAAQAAPASSSEAAPPRAAASRSTRTPASPTAPRTSAPAAPAPAAAAQAPASGGAPEFSAGALGEAINAHRAAHGLPSLRVSRSGGLYAHASAMAQKGSIWHSGSDNIVGFVQPAGALSLVRAWADSPAHNAWMLRSGISAMHVGAAVVDDRLYGAVAFS